jgi:hypothetical protein
MTAYTLPEGWAANPLKGRARNLACPCGTGEKVKRCCGQFPVVPVETARALRFWLRKVLG